jgi:hypothetical protein
MLMFAVRSNSSSDKFGLKLKHTHEKDFFSTDAGRCVHNRHAGSEMAGSFQ